MYALMKESFSVVGQVISQGSIYLSQILDPAPLAQIKTFSDALQVYAIFFEN